MVYNANYRNITPAVATALARGAADVVNGTVENLMKNKVFKAQANSINLKAKLAELDTTQQYELARRLQEAKTDNERFAIMSDAVSQINVQSVASEGDIYEAAIAARAKETQTTAIIIGAAVILVIGAYFVIYKR